MLSWLPPVVRGTFTSVLLGLNTLVIFTSMMPFALLKLLLPIQAVRPPLDRVLNALASGWVTFNGWWIRAVNPKAIWDITGLDTLKRRGWYLVSSNHQTWVDILVLQRTFNGRIPFLKFFLKRELIWVPVIGLAWWALDFPFMKRGKGGGASRAKDLETTRRACEKFKQLPTSVINFVEGTRFTPAKHAKQRSPYRHLLKPKIGGLGIALATMGEQFESLLDITIAYPKGIPTFWDLLCGRMETVLVRVRELKIPTDVLGGDPISDQALRQRISDWVGAQWDEKDRQLTELLGETARPATSA